MTRGWYPRGHRREVQHFYGALEVLPASSIPGPRSRKRPFRHLTRRQRDQLILVSPGLSWFEYPSVRSQDSLGRVKWGSESQLPSLMGSPFTFSSSRLDTGLAVVSLWGPG